MNAKRSVGRDYYKETLDCPIEFYYPRGHTPQLHEIKLLHKAGIFTLRDLRDRGETGLLLIPGAGPGLVDHAKFCLRGPLNRTDWLPKAKPAVRRSVLCHLTPVESVLLFLLEERHGRINGKGHKSQSDIIKAGLVALSKLSHKTAEQLLRKVAWRTPTQIGQCIEHIGVEKVHAYPWVRAAARGVVIDAVMSKFDFVELLKIFKRLNLKWPYESKGKKRLPRRPSRFELEEKAEELIRTVLFTEATEAQYHGLRASRNDGYVHLSFELLSCSDRPARNNPIERTIKKALKAA